MGCGDWGAGCVLLYEHRSLLSRQEKGQNQDLKPCPQWKLRREISSNSATRIPQIPVNYTELRSPASHKEHIELTAYTLKEWERPY